MSAFTGIFYFVGHLHANTKKLKELLERHKKHVFICTNKDEIEQGARQSGKAILIFSDPKFAIQYLRENHWSNVSMKYYLLIEKDGFFNEETNNLFRELRLNVFIPKKFPELVEDIRTYLTKSDTEINDSDIEFSVQLEAKRK